MRLCSHSVFYFPPTAFVRFLWFRFSLGDISIICYRPCTILTASTEWVSCCRRQVWWKQDAETLFPLMLSRLSWPLHPPSSASSLLSELTTSHAMSYPGFSNIAMALRSYLYFLAIPLFFFKVECSTKRKLWAWPVWLSG